MKRKHAGTFTLGVRTHDVHGPTSITPSLRAYAKNVNDNHTQSDQLELYRGRHYGLALAIGLMEHDHGDVEGDRQKISEAFKKAHD